MARMVMTCAVHAMVGVAILRRREGWLLLVNPNLLDAERETALAVANEDIDRREACDPGLAS